jgi:hypothetical protein
MRATWVRSLVLATATVAALALSACGEGSALSRTGGVPGTSPSSTPAPLLLLPPSGSIYLGAYVNPTNITPAPVTEIATLEASIGRTFALDTHYYGFYDSFPGAYEAYDAANGRIPVDSWDCGPSNAAIASGAQDSTIRARAEAIKAYGKPIFLRYMWEMNLPSNKFFRTACYDPATDLPNGQFSPQEYIAAWDHIRAIFAQEGVGNVIWLWNPDGSNNPASYYPGASEVDWVGFDLYDTVNVGFAQTYQQAYTWLSVYGKPIMVGETGATATEQPAFFAAAASTLQQQFPDIKGYIYFDSLNPAFVNSWVISPSAIPDFAAMAKSAYLSAVAP